MERLEEIYKRGVLDMDGVTHEYMIKEVLQKEKIRGRAGRRA